MKRNMVVNRSIHDDWSSKGLLIASNLNVKYVILFKIGIPNWTPSSHGSSITPSLARLLYQIGTKVAFDFGEYVF